ncbi:MAG TPA: CHAT domain-containing tetratricopeptide repeat protein [Stellaceae bacterium]|nr:CHAT domain-containing tetratricopeptide repeat protein [Stellaceae bacterium]
MRRSLPLAAVLLVAAVAACTGGGKDAAGVAGISPAAGGSDGGLGQNLAGESCRTQPRTGASALPGEPAPLGILCGSGKEPVGSLWTAALPASELTGDADQRHARILRASAETPGGRRAGERLTCDGGEWTGGSVDMRVSTCTLKVQGWPQVVLLADIGGVLYQAEGLPSLLPVLTAAIAQRSGQAIPPADSAGASKIVTAHVKGGAEQMRSADLGSLTELVRLGRFYNSTQNFAGAENAFRKALDIENRVLGPDAEGTGSVMIELALQVSNQNRFDEAAGLFHRADPIIQRSTSDTLHARYSSYLALDAANQRKYSEALAYAREATATRRKRVESQGDTLTATVQDPQQFGARGELAHSLRIEAAMALRLGDTTSALAAISEALEIMSATPGLPLSWRPEALALLAEVDAADGRFSAAQRDLGTAVALSRKLFGETAPTALVLLRRAKLQTDIERDQDALRDFQAAFAIVATDETARSQLVSDQVTPFFTAASTLASADQKQRATLADDMFRASQYVSSGVTDQTIDRAAARLSTNDPAIADLIRQTQAAERARDAARLELANEQAKPDVERGSIKETALAQLVEQQTATAAALQKKLIAAFPAYASLAQPGPVGLIDVQKRLGADEAFLSFVIGHRESYAMLLRREGFTVHKIEATDATLAEKVAQLREALGLKLGTLPDFDLGLAHELYAQLIGPFEAQLSGITHLVVATPGTLASLPFSLLVTREPAARHDYAAAAWLIRRMAVSEVPSPRAFVDLRDARAHAKSAPRPFLGVGNPTFAGAAATGKGQPSALEALAGSCRENGPVQADLIRALAPLPETADEVRRVGARLNADPNSILLGAAASEANLRRQPLGDYNVLYFATHGLLPGELRCESEPGLALSPPAGAATSAADDGLLDASEVASLSLNAELVVLSACNTAAGGGRFGGEALSGLAEAFFYAGARTLVASHWQVPSLATVRLMTGLFDRAGPQLSGGIAESLRQAQLAIAADAATAHPYYWAAFTVIGDGGRAGNLSAQASIGTANADGQEVKP